MYTRNGFTTGDEQLIRLFNGMHAGLVLFGVLLFGVGIVFSLATSGVVDPGMPSFGDDSDDETVTDDPGDSAPEDDGEDADGGDSAGGDESDEAGGDDANDDSADDAGGDDAGGDGADGGDDDETGADDETDADGRDDETSEDVAEPETSLLAVTVVNPVGDTIEGVEIRGEGEPHESDVPLEFSGETDADGTYTDEIYENEYTIEFEHPDYETETIEHDHDGEHELTVELEPEDAPDASMMRLTVTDSDGEPIEGASVRGEGEPHESDVPLEFSGETDADGTYTDVIYENEYTIEIDHPDYESLTGTYSHEGDQEVTAQLEED